MKVYIVKLREHDDLPKILGVFDTEEKARAKFEEYINEHNPDDDFELSFKSWEVQ